LFGGGAAPAGQGLFEGVTGGISEAGLGGIDSGLGALLPMAASA
jgi:hypothetical protein